MLRVATNQALPGMRLAVPVYHPLRGKVLLTEGFELEESIIRRLVELEIQHVWIEYPGFEQIKQYVSPTILNQQGQLVSLMAEALDSMHREAHAEIEFADYRKAIQCLIEDLVCDPTAAAYIVELGGSSDSDLRHASEVCFLSLLLGLKLQGYLIQQRKRLHPRDARDVVSLGLGAMLHDIGMMALDPAVRRQCKQNRDESNPEWRKHVKLGHKMLSGNIAPAAAGVVLHHHQHFDGSGFPTTIGVDGRPRGLVGEDIHVFARIVCVANHFDRLRRPENGVELPRVRVMRQMLSDPLVSRFDPIVLAALPLVVPAFPPGTVATLNNGERVVVVQWHPEAPCQPTVQVLQDAPLAAARNGAAPVRYDLRQRTDLLIVEHEGVDVRNDQFRLISSNASTSPAAA